MTKFRVAAEICESLSAAFLVALLVVSATLPIVIPFALIDNLWLAMRVVATILALGG